MIRIYQKKDINAVEELQKRYPHQCDWFAQDCIRRSGPAEESTDFKTDIKDYIDHKTNELEQTMIRRVFAELAGKVDNLQKELETLNSGKLGPENPAWLALYEKACFARRAERLKPLLAKTKSIIFAKHHVFGSKSGILYITETEGGLPGSAICQIELLGEGRGEFAKTSVVFDAKDGIARDPDLSFDAERLLFAWRKTRDHFATVKDIHENRDAPKTGNYQIYEMELATKNMRQLTTDDTYGANFEPCHLPNGDIMFSSARIVQHITCGWGDCSNLFVMNKDGRYARRVGFDQTNTAFPTLLDDGRVVFLRRDYNDRAQSGAHALFVMHPDGTAQSEMYGNQTGTPNSFQHARGIPGTRKLMVILGGYHTTQGGKLAVMDVAKGRQLGNGLLLIPGKTKPAASDGYADNYGKKGVQYANPFPLSETEFLISRSTQHYAVFFMTDDGRRELLASDPAISCLQAIPVMPRPRPASIMSGVDYTKNTSTIFLQNAYIGQGTQGAQQGTIKKIRVVELLYKPVNFGWALGYGPGGFGGSITPIGSNQACFDAKRIIGEATVHSDGSAFFKVPSRKPFYFQLLDDKNRVIQTMRSWTTLMPNETISCVGCHEDKNMPPPMNDTRQSLASRAGVEELRTFHGIMEPFSYPKFVQPVLDRHCVSCHNPNGKGKSLVLSADPKVKDPSAFRTWNLSYFNLTKARPGPNPERITCGFYGPKYGLKVDPWTRSGPAMPDEPNRYLTWWGRLGSMGPKAPNTYGSIASGMIKLLEKGHNDVKLSPMEWDLLCAWIDLNIVHCGLYDEANTWTDKQKNFYQSRLVERARNEAIEAKNIQEYINDGQPK